MKILKIKPVYKILVIALLFFVSYLGFHAYFKPLASLVGSDSEMKFMAYLSLFCGLFLIFEGFNLSLFYKIIVALILGLIMSLSGLFPAADLVEMRPVGSVIFMNCLTMVLVPLVFSSILTGVTSLGDINRLERIGFRTIAYYVTTTAIAISIGLFLANMVNPGAGLKQETRDKMMQQYQTAAQSKVDQAKKNQKTAFQTLQSIFPKNALTVASQAKPDMLSIIFVAIICGLALLKIDSKYSQPVIQFFTGITEMTVRIIVMVMRLAPYGVFALITSTIAQTQDIDFLLALIPFSLTVIAGLLIHMFGMNTLSLKFLSKFDIRTFFKHSKEVMITAFSTQSSGATMPVTLSTCEKKLGLRNEVASFVVPLGATVNMDGTALFQGVSAIFLANIYGIHLGLADQLTIVAMAVLASIGTAAVPGVGVVILTMILVSVGIPPQGILFILPVNNLLDMFRTVVNVVGDMGCTVYINSCEDRADAESGNDPEAVLSRA